MVLEQQFVGGLLMLIRPSHRRHVREGGLTLIEMIVALAIVAVMAGSVGAIFSVGLLTLKPNGTTDRLAGANDFMVLEQQLGRDGGRAACIQLPTGAKYGSCSSGHGYGNFLSAPGCTNSLCLAWPQLSDGSCQVALYNVGSKVIVSRALYVVNAAGAVSLSLKVQLTSDHADLAVASPLTVADPSGHTWPREVDIAFTAEGNGNGGFVTFSKTIALHPVSTDPDGATAAVGSNAVSPC